MQRKLPHSNLYLREEELRRGVELLYFAYRDFTRDPDEILAESRFGRAHHRVLHFVAGNPGISIADLLDILRVTKQSLARVLRDLIDGDYIEQRIGANDRRKRLLHLTGKGLALHAKLLAPQEKRFDEVLTAIGPQAFEQWKKTMRLVINREDRENVDELIIRSRQARSEDGK
ncbi:MAG: MarR family transcriptional regulator [Rhodobiaceae bacterium]